MTSRLRADRVTLRYDERVVAADLTVHVPDDSFTVVVGPNACGKSTLLRALARLLRPAGGEVFLDDAPIRSRPAKETSRRLAMLPQAPTAPDGITVVDLVARGRFPHQGLLRQWSVQDEEAVRRAMAATGVTDLADRPAGELSGGQRQRVWLAMVLAQDTSILLLDEPTTFLDVAHQIEVLDLCRDLHEDQGRTVVAVLHDLNHAARYATHLVAMRDGRVVAQGPPHEVVTAERVEEVFGLPCRVVEDPVTGAPLVLPLDRRRTRTVSAGAGPSADPTGTRSRW
ncbi:ABC transporter ATP-binding protein [Cellulomonas oligotrophica]|uniref:ABC transporter n=1 Tax=Cellulomonas oligotrophica TaxID=931536 RepID=A0A7Y9FFN3_9CELL|nr:ABC transporter ATP-binding protein [Cellulomonas oligotrophica]NYD86369.1 iron complex transport system ATP-binding protein [Cellulomonas oligotrophica]GIG32740.1 ABC transporter [Cellulomonas oligotrophica]